MSDRRKPKKKKHSGVLVVPVLLALGGVGGYYGWQYMQTQNTVASSPVGSYKTETVRRGDVVTGVSEDGTIEFGTTEQTFSVAEITEVSLSSSSDTDTSTSKSGNSSGSTGASGMPSTGGDASGGMPGGMGGDMGSAMMGGGFSSSASSDDSSDTTSLTVDTVYVATGQVVSKGDQILKITDDSIEEYRTQLQAAVDTAELSVKQEEINAETNKSTAEYTYQMYLAEGKVAQENYDATILSLEKAVTDVEDEIADAQEDVDTYQSYVDDGEDYDDELSDAKDKLETLEANLQIAKNDLTTGTLEAKETLETALTNYKYADQLHEIDTNGLEDDLNDAKEVLEDAKNALADFEEQIGDGIVYAEYDGTVTEVAYAAGDSITNDATLVTFTDPANVVMTVSVSQNDIFNVSVGSESSVTLNAFPGKQFTGTVQSISTSASTGSSTVNYEVSVLLTGDTSSIYTGMDGKALFAGKQSTDVLYISNKAVHLAGTTSWVWLQQEDGSVDRQDITTGYSNSSIVEVTSGLEEGQTIAIESQVVS